MPATCHRGQSIRTLCLALIYVHEETEIQRKLDNQSHPVIFKVYFLCACVCLSGVCALMCVHVCAHGDQKGLGFSFCYPGTRT